MSEEKKKIAFIINPVSGTQNKEVILKSIDGRLDKKKYACEVVYTERVGHAIEIAAQKAAEKYFAVVAIGGDGTINEVARSLIHTDTALGIIPCGSGNGLARHLQIPMDVAKAIDIINEGCIEAIDYGVINNNTPFFCTCGVGFDALVSMRFTEAGKRGLLTYLEQTVKESWKYKPETYELIMDGVPSQHKAFVIACGNASQYGNNAYIAPQATLNDGLLDVTILEPFNMLEAPSISFQLFNKTIDQNSRVKTYRCKSLHIHRCSAGAAHYDGEPVMLDADIDVRIVQQGLKMIIPSEDKKDKHAFKKVQEYFNEWKQINDAIVEDFNYTNKRILVKGKKQIQKLKGNLS
ncbi:MAG: diacylglycerol kinase family lipid kinase [Bacteroides sp.]|nr:diacylglycerol kinase family lipid kinase [Bacteroides sp.]